MSVSRACRGRPSGISMISPMPGGLTAHHGHPVAEQDGLLDVVGDEDDRDAVLLPDVQQELVHPLPGDGVQGAERLVHQQQRRPGGQRAGECRPVPHAARQLVRERVAEPAQADPFQQRSGLLVEFGVVAFVLPGGPLRPRAEQDVVPGGEPAEQHRRLEQHAPVGGRAGDRPFPHRDGSLVGGQRAGDDPQQRRLAAAGRPEQAGQLARPDPQAGPGQRHRPPPAPAEGLADRVDHDLGTGGARQVQRPRRVSGRPVSWSSHRPAPS